MPSSNSTEILQNSQQTNTPADWHGSLIAALFAFSATVLSIWLILLHLRNYNKPVYQRHIVRILFMVPIFSLTAWFTYLFPAYAVGFDFVRSCFEAFVIYEFFSLLLSYLGNSDLERRNVLSFKDSEQLPPPLCCLSYNPHTRYFLMDMKLLVLQYIIVRPLTTVIAVILEAKGLLHPGSFDPRFGMFWFTLFNFISVSVAMYSLVLFFIVIQHDISEYRPINKFLSVKFVVFLTFWQSLLVGACAHFGLIPDSQYWSADHISIRVQSFLLCIEMFIAAIWHMRDKCFGYSDFRAAEESNIWDSLMDCFNPVETFKDTWQSLAHLVKRSHHLATRPHHEPVHEIELDASTQLDFNDMARLTPFEFAMTLDEHPK